MEEEKTSFEGRKIADVLEEINLEDFKKDLGKEEPGKEIPPGEEGKEEPTEEPKVTEVSLSTGMLIGLIGFVLSMRYLPDKVAVSEFNKKYREELPKVIQSFGLEEVFDQVCASTLTFKIKESDVFAVPLPGWVGLAAVIGVLIVAGLFIRVPTKKTPKTHKDMREGKEHTLGKKPRED